MAGAIMNKVWDLFGMDTERDAEEVEEKTYDNNDYDTYDGYDEEENDEIEDRRIFGKRNKEKVVSMPQTQQIKMVISQPTTFDQSEEILGGFFNGRSYNEQSMGFIWNGYRKRRRRSRRKNI